MHKTRQERLDDTLSYIDRIPDLSPAHVAQLRSAKRADLAASDQISLGIRPLVQTPQETQRRRALRALLLCLHWAGCANQIASAKQAYHNSSEANIVDAISSFFPLMTGSAQTVMDAARNYRPVIGGGGAYLNDTYRYRRGAVRSGNPAMGGNCYSAVTIWLYLGGVVSLRWMRQCGEQPGNEVPRYFTWGPPINTAGNAEDIPPGQICRIERGGAHGLHYVLTIGPGVCAGLNNSVDICQAWLPRYGTTPTTDYSQFEIAGYLASLQNVSPDGGKINTARCLPTLAYTF
jgi:hypothetical protein